MTEPICEDDGTLREWFPETRLLQQIPLKVQRGIFSYNLNLTCIDAVAEFLALGTSCGLVYWYRRTTNDLQRLRLENSNNIVTCVKIVSTVDYMVAAGTDHGNVTVFQVPKAIPESIPDSMKSKKNQVERFTINGLHSAPVTSIEWSQNGMKLFSGDKNGLVVLTEIDFYMHLSKSMELLNEQFEIVQLSYSQQNLLISTTFRSIICDGIDKWKVHQVGTKERKTLGKFGATFFKLDHGMMIYASRPGHRLWLANKDGSVQQTLLFKSAISSSSPRIQLINPSSKIHSCDTNFGKLVQFGCNKLIAYNSEIMHVLHPGTISLISSLDSARKIIDLAVNEDEIFILEGERSLLRISYTPDKYCTDSISENTSRRRSFIFDDIAAKLKDTAVESFKKIASELVITPEKTSPSSPPAVADEALNLPPIVSLPPGSISTLVPEENVEIHFSVDASESYQSGITTLPDLNSPTFEEVIKGKECQEILSRPLRRRNHKANKILTAVQGQESESDSTSNASEDRLVWGIANEMSASEESSISLTQSHSSFSILRDIPTLLASNKSKTTRSKSLRDEEVRNLDNKSQLSVDTCESVSEHLQITPEKFTEEQEKTFFRLANQEISLFDSYNSEKTDNMSISFNMTPSSSVSSKISDNGQSNSEISESIVSENKTDNSPSSENSHHDSLPLPKHPCFCVYKEKSVSSQENQQKMSENSSASSENSQKVSSIDNYVHLPNETLPIHMKNGSNVAGISRNSDHVGSGDNAWAVMVRSKSNSDGELGRDNSVVTVNTEYNDWFMDKLLLRSSPEKCQDDDSNHGDYGFKNEEYPAEPVTCIPLLGSNTLDRCNTRNSSFFIGSASQPDLYIEYSDHWLQYIAPGPIASLAVSSTYVVCTDTKEQVYFSGLSGLSLSWNALSYKASGISLSNSGSVVWILNKKTLYSMVNPSKKGPFADEMLEQSSNVALFAVDNENPEGWMVMTDGRVKLQRNLLFNPFGTQEDIPCDWLITDIACWNGTVLALTCDGSVICKPQFEGRFRSILTPKPVISFVELGPDNLAWVVDDKNQIYFSDDFLSEEPHWWQILISDYVFQNSGTVFQNIQIKLISYNIAEHIRKKCTIISTNENSIWVCDRFSSVLKVNKTAVTGYIWKEIFINLSLTLVTWLCICANGVFENSGHLWLYSNSGDIFYTKPNSKYFQSVPVPGEDIRCMSSSTNSLFVISTDGLLYSRLGLNEKNLVGTSWKELYSPMTEDRRLVWVSCGCDVIWGCDAHGRMYIAMASPHELNSKSFEVQWVEVDGQPKNGTQFEKVFVGPKFFMVWAIDNKQNIYVREGIFSELKMGVNWVFVAGLQASVLTMSNSSLWALSPVGNVYRRYGITENNYVGDYWRRVPGMLKCITSSLSDELWGIDRRNVIMKLTRKTKVFGTKKVTPVEETFEPSSLTDTETDWEIPEGVHLP